MSQDVFTSVSDWITWMLHTPTFKSGEEKIFAINCLNCHGGQARRVSPTQGLRQRETLEESFGN